MSLPVEAIPALEVLVARVEDLTGQRCDLPSRMVLSFAARHLATGRPVSMRLSAQGVVVEVLRRKEPTL